MPDLSYADLSYARLSHADLSHAVLRHADLAHAHLNDADLRGAHLNDADLSRADLIGARLIGARLIGVNLSGAVLGGADFTDVIMGDTTFADNDLSRVKGLETVIHLAPSTVGIDTIYKSRGNIPEIFLRGCGVPESFIVQMHALVASTEAIQFYSCFISYSSKDQDFADRLYADLQSRGVRCWFAPRRPEDGRQVPRQD